MINFANLFLNLSEILHVTTALVGADAPVIISAIPGGVSGQTSGYIALGELELDLADQVLGAIVAAHTAKVAANAAAAAAPPVIPVPVPAAPVPGAVDVAQGEGLVKPAQGAAPVPTAKPIYPAAV